jgi:hypothetical protein
MGRMFVMVVRVPVMVLVMRIGVFRSEYIQFGGRDATAHHFARFKGGANLQGIRCLNESLHWHASIDKGAQQHVAANTGKAIQIGYLHRN